MKTDYKGELFAALQRLLPQHSLSRILAMAANSRQPWLKDHLIRRAIEHFDIDMAEAINSDPESYASFNQFFTRELKEGARPIDPNPRSIVSPADGCISQIGQITDGDIFQAKGASFSAHALLGGSEDTARVFHRGIYTTIYLSPRDYHRVHMPFSGRLLEARYIPGRLFSVNDTTTRQIPGLFARNERLACLFDTEAGKMAVVMVGALFVAGIESRWQPSYKPGRMDHRLFTSNPLAFARGDEMGQFHFGSTVILLFEEGNQWSGPHCAGSTVRLGERLGNCRANSES